MILLGHKFLEAESLYHVRDIDAIMHTPPSATLYLEFSEENLDIIEHARANGVAFSLGASSITELIYASSLGAKYVLLNKSLAKIAQEIAETYLFDTKILVHIEKDKEIEEMALLGIDGVIYPNAIIKINS
jgi:hypothetical protein